MKKAIKKRKLGRPAAADLQAHREAILNAATDVFLESGFTKASTAEIARRAGASKGTLYSLYPSKSTLYAALLERRVTVAVAPLVQDRLSEEAPIRETLVRFGLGILRFVTSDEAQRLYRLIVAETGEFPELGAALWENGPGRGLEMLEKYLDLLVANSKLDIPDTKRAAHQFLGMVLGLSVLRGSLRLPNLNDSAQAEEALVQGATNTFLDAYRQAHHEC